MTNDTLGFVLHVGHTTQPKETKSGAVIPASLPGAGRRESELCGEVAAAAVAELRRLDWLSLRLPAELGRVTIDTRRPDFACNINAADTWRRSNGLSRAVFISLHYDLNVKSEDGAVYVDDSDESLTLAGELVQSGPDIPFHIRRATSQMWPVGPSPKAVSLLHVVLGNIASRRLPAGTRDLAALGKWLGRALSDGAAQL